MIEAQGRRERDEGMEAECRAKYGSAHCAQSPYSHFGNDECLILPCVCLDVFEMYNVQGGKMDWLLPRREAASDMGRTVTVERVTS